MQTAGRLQTHGTHRRSEKRKATNKNHVGGQLRVNYITRCLPRGICTPTWPRDKVKLFLVTRYLLVPVIQKASGMPHQQMAQAFGFITAQLHAV